MVVFACSACGESLKKNQVENHYLRKCRNCNMLSCLDCGKDFWGNEYEQHTKCITEEEKYSGKNYVPKPGSNKNEIKQQNWLQQVQEAVDKCRTNPKLKSLLIRLKDQPNVPRKKNKFLNFLSNGFHVKDSNLASQVWDMLMANTENKQQSNNQSSNDNNNSSKPDNHSIDVKPTESVCANDKDSVETEHVSEPKTELELKKLSKREKKEERRKKLHKTEKKDKNRETGVEEVVQENGIFDSVTENNSKGVKGNRKSNKKSKKRKRDADQNSYQDGDADLDTGNQSISDAGNQSVCDDDMQEPARKKFKTKFNWNETILEVLQTKGPEMKMKRLRKKVLAEYLSEGCTEKSEENLWARFEKKLKKIPDVKVLGERVKLKSAS